MDFLRRLAPVRQNDTTQAVAALPSRFASAGPLAATIGGTTHVGRSDEDPVSFDHDPTSALVEAVRNGPPGAARRAQETSAHRYSDLRAAIVPAPTVGGPGGQPPADGGVAFPMTVAPGPPSAPLHRVDGPAMPPPRQARIGASDFKDFDAGTSVRDRQDTLAPSDASGRAAASAAWAGLQGIAAAATRAGTAAPLSAASVAHRQRGVADGSQVVHVTIGRIDVVAVTAPPPAVRRSVAPRPGTATLSEYLRGANGSRR